MARVATLSTRRHRQRHRQRASRGLAIGVDVGGTWIRVAAAAGGRPAAALVLRSTREPAVLARILRGLWRRRGFRRGRVAALAGAPRGVRTAGAPAARAPPAPRPSY